MAPEIGVGLMNPPSPAKSKNVLKKGPWTTSEDLLLLDYVKKHGEGNWNAVQKNSQLMRCGKSCRLRWANHLRPNLKKGAFSPEEEQLIVELHAKLGNKWARMAAQIPGRTDNEIKNYWNTRVKRRLRAGLPIYPLELAVEEQRRRHQAAAPKQQRDSHSLSSLLASSEKPNPFLFNPLIISPGANQTSNKLKLYRDDNGGVALSLLSPSSSSSFFNQGVGNDQLPMDSLVRYDSVEYGGCGMEALGLPSIQGPPPTAAAVTPAASSIEFAAACDGGEGFEGGKGSKNGLLEDLFGETQTLEYFGKEEEQFVGAGGNFHEEGVDFGFSHDVNSSHDSYEGVETKAPEEGMASMDDELMNLLDNFPLSVPIPDWNGEDGSESPILSNGTSNSMHGQPVAPEYNPVAASTGAANQEWKFGSCLWNNMPSIY